MVKHAALSLLLLTFATAALAADVDLGPGTATGAPALASVGPLAFGPDGVLFVGDSIGGAVWAIDTGDVTPAGDGPMELQRLDAKLAELAGTTPDRIRIHDLAVNPLSRRAYLSVSRGQGEDAKPAIFTLAPGGALELFAFDRRHARAALVDAPDPPPPDAAARASASTPSPTSPSRTAGYWSPGSRTRSSLRKLRVLDFPFGGNARGAQRRDLPRLARQVGDQRAGAHVHHRSTSGRCRTSSPPTPARRW